jgi:hypothetical protein
MRGAGFQVERHKPGAAIIALLSKIVIGFLRR